MRLTELPIPGCYLVDIEPVEDERGFFARTVCAEEFARAGLNAAFVQQSVSWNPRKGTLRGLHYQAAPWEEEKLVRVTRGAVFDVLVDLRVESVAYGKWHAIELSADSRSAVYVPKGVAHGFQTLADHTELLYQITIPYRPEAGRGLRWDDPALDIAWPMPPVSISARDSGYPDFFKYSGD